MSRSRDDLIKDLDKLVKGYELATNPNESMRFCIYKSYKMYWLLLEVRKVLKDE